METRREYTRIPLALPTVALIAGIVLYRYLPSPSLFAAVLAVAAAAAAAATVFRRAPRWSLPAILSIVFFGLGGIAAYVSAPADAVPLAGAERLEGTVRQSVMTASGYRLTVDVERACFPDGSSVETDNLRMILTTDGPTADAGHIIRFPARFSEAANLPIFDADRYAKTLLTKGIRYSCRAAAEEVETLAPSHSLTATAARLRDKVECLILSSSLRPAAKAFATAIITADRSLIADDTVARFSQAGIAHILALSGLHIGIIAAMAAMLLIPLNLLLHFKLRYLAIIISLWAFALFTGFAAPTTRACVMATVFYIELILERPHSHFNALCAATLVIAIATPAAVFDPGFQLSIACVGSIILLAGRLNPIRRREHPTLHSATGIVVTSLIASLGSWIITGYYFRNIPLANLPANMIAIPLTAPFLALSILHTLLLAFGLQVKALEFILDNAYELLDRLAGTMASDTPFTPSADAAILWTLAIIFLGIAIHWKRRGWMKYLPAAATALSAAAIAFLAPDVREEGIIISQHNGTLQISYRLPGEEGNVPFSRGITSFAQFGPHRCAILQKPLHRLNARQRAMLANSNVIILAGAFTGPLPQLHPSASPQEPAPPSHLPSPQETAPPSPQKTASPSPFPSPRKATPAFQPSPAPLIILGPYLRRPVRASLESALATTSHPHIRLTSDRPIRLTTPPPN